MSSNTPVSRVQLPAEVLLHIFDSLVPSHPVPIAHPASDPITKTLLSLALTSREFYLIARRYLYAHCLYIDSISRLRALVPTLHLFHQRDLENPQFSILPHIKSLYFQLPKPNIITEQELDIDEANAVYHLVELLAILKPSLQRLLLDISNQSLSNFHQTDETPLETLRKSITSLHELEVFFSMYLDLFMTSDGLPGIDMASAWPKLRVVGIVDIYVHDTTEEFWRSVAKTKCLETVVLLIQGPMMRTRDKWFSDNVFGIGSERKLNAVCVSMSAAYVGFSDVWIVENNMRVREVRFPLQLAMGRVRKVREETLEWIKRRMLRGDDCVGS